MYLFLVQEIVDYLFRIYDIACVCSERSLDYFPTTNFTKSFKKLDNHHASLSKSYYSSSCLISDCGHLEGRDYYSLNHSLQLTMTCHDSGYLINIIELMNE